MNARQRIALTMALTTGVAAPLVADTLVSTDFEGLTLLPFVSTTETGGDGTDWAPGLPAGWSMTYDGPLGNPIEFQGWHVMDVDSWIATEGNQERATWTRGGVGAHGSALVADADAYDDGTDVDTGRFNTYARTPAIDLSQVAPAFIQISFDSFWRTEVTQKGQVQVSFDGGATFETLKTYDSNALPDGEVIDERVDLTVSNPGTGSLVVQLAYTEASNDWWWAVDNVQINATAVPEPSVTALGVFGLALLAFARRR